MGSRSVTTMQTLFTSLTPWRRRPCRNARTQDEIEIAIAESTLEQKKNACQREDTFWQREYGDKVNRQASCWLDLT